MKAALAAAISAAAVVTGAAQQPTFSSRVEAVRVDVLVKDTRVSYGQVVRTDGEGYYKATFHLHNDNRGDPLLVEAKGEQQDRKVEFDPNDLESERKIRVNFGTGCEASESPVWLWWGSGAVVAAAGGIIGMRLIRSQRKWDRGKARSQGKRKP